MVFVHGVSGSSSAWIKYEEKFAKEYNILTYDLRGHGKSFRYKEYDDYEINKFTEDLKFLIDFLQIKDFTLIGHSYGVFIVLDFVSKYENFVKKIVLLSPHFNVMKMKTGRISKFFIDFISKIKFPISNKKDRKHLGYEKYLNTGDFNIKRTFADVSNTSLQVYLMCIKHSYLWNYENILSSIKIPVLIVGGEKDKIFPNEYAQIMAQKIPNAKIVTIKNTDHIIVLNNFKEVSTAIDDFLKI